MAMGDHQSAASKSVVWLTPRYILDALGPFDLDPCAAEQDPIRAAPLGYTERVDGLAQQWEGRVWLNPPYGKLTGFWLKRLADHGDGIALIFARTETAMFFDEVWDKASALLFLRGRLHFCHKNGVRCITNAGAPSVLVAYGNKNAEIVRECSLSGQYIELR